MKSADYINGFRDDASINQKYPQTFMFMGYSMEQLVEIIHKENDQKYKNREAFRKALGDAGFAGFTTFSSPILEAYDNVHCPELRK